MLDIPKFIPVIHVSDTLQAIDQAKIAFDNGAGGIFLIDHRRKYTKLYETYQEVKNIFNNAWIGLNFLDLNPLSAMKFSKNCEGLNGLWMDSVGGIDNKDCDCKVFAGVAFKYQPQPEDLEKETQKISKMFDVATTSGVATGSAPDLKKIRIMKESIGESPLAIASGITVENIEHFLPFVDCFMVATGISHDFHNLDSQKVAEISNIIQ